MSSSRGILVALTTIVLLLAACPEALALPPAAGIQPGHSISVAAAAKRKEQHSTFCEVAGPVIGGLIPSIGRVIEASPSVCESAGNAIGGLAGEAASSVGNSVLEGITTWMIGAATQITVFVSREMQQTTTPQLESAWYVAQFRPMADLGAALSLLVAMIGLASAAIRRSPEALAATLIGMVRAGLGTGLVIPLTVIGLEIADQISTAVLTASPHAFWATLAHAWGTKGFGGFGSSALATLIALIEVFAGVCVWLELIARNAAIYIAPLFFAATLAASIWPVLGSWPGRLGRLLLLFVIFKPVALIVLALAGSAAAAGLSFGGGASTSIGTILAAVVIFALAAFAPWALMYLLAADAETAYMAAGLRAATGSAVADKDARSARSGGGLRNLASQNGGAAGGRAPGGGVGGGGGGDQGGGGGPVVGGGPGAGGSGTRAAESDGAGDDTLAVRGETVGAGSIAAAAGASPQGMPSASTTQGSAGQQGGAQPTVSQRIEPHEDGARGSGREHQAPRPPERQEQGRRSPRSPVAREAGGPQRDADGAGGQGRFGESGGAPRTSRPSGGEPRRRPARSPALAVVGPSRPSSSRLVDEEG